MIDDPRGSPPNPATLPKAEAPGSPPAADDPVGETDHADFGRFRCRFCGATCGDVIWQRADWPGSPVLLRRARRPPG